MRSLALAEVRPCERYSRIYQSTLHVWWHQLMAATCVGCEGTGLFAFRAFESKAKTRAL
jgi:hypothetical protein